MNDKFLEYRDLYQEVDSTTGRLKKPNEGMGIMEQMQNSGNIQEYKIFTGSVGLAMVKQFIRTLYPLTMFTDLLKFPHFRPINAYIPGTTTLFNNLWLWGSENDYPYKEVKYHPLDHMLYKHARELEIRQMKRMRAYIELENQL